MYFDENDEAHKLTDICQMRGRVATNPIIDWTDTDVWKYIKDNGLKINPLYGSGFRRVGCIGCPMATTEKMLFNLALYPKYEAAYIRAFDKMVKVREERGAKRDGDLWQNGAEVMAWWVDHTNKKTDASGAALQMEIESYLT